MAPTIERSPGLPVTVGGLPTGYLAGGGYRGATLTLDETVQAAAELLAETYEMDVTIRFNSDRRSGGAWLKTDDEDGFYANAEIGICASLRFRDQAEKEREIERLTRSHGADSDFVRWVQEAEPGLIRVQAHIGARALTDKTLATSYQDDPVRAYYHGPADSLVDALAFVQAHGDLGRVREWQGLAGVARFLIRGGELAREAAARPARRGRRAY